MIARAEMGLTKLPFPLFKLAPSRSASQDLITHPRRAPFPSLSLLRTLIPLYSAPRSASHLFCRAFSFSRWIYPCRGENRLSIYTRERTLPRSLPIVLRPFYPSLSPGLILVRLGRRHLAAPTFLLAFSPLAHSSGPSSNAFNQRLYRRVERENHPPASFGQSQEIKPSASLSMSSVPRYFSHFPRFSFCPSASRPHLPHTRFLSPSVFISTPGARARPVSRCFFRSHARLAKTFLPGREARVFDAGTARLRARAERSGDRHESNR